MLKGQKHSVETKARISAGLKGRECSPETRAKIGASNSGKPCPEHVKELKRQLYTGRTLSLEHRANIKKAMQGVVNTGQFKKGRELPIEVRRLNRERQLGEKSHLWKGGLTAKNSLQRNSLDTRLWREAVFKRDDFTCQECLVRGGKLQADHIRPWALYPELRFAINNGRTLCADCHKKTPTYLKSNLTRADVEMIYGG